MSDTALAASIQFYLVLGLPGSGRREVLADLVQGGLDPALDRAHVYLPAAAQADPAELTGVASTSTLRWDADLQMFHGDSPAEGVTHAFALLDPLADPADQLEALKPWLSAHSLAVARIITVVHCALMEKTPALLPWLDACVHFSDVVLLNRREGVANKWLSELRRRYDDQCMPCLFEFVKGGKVRNPVLLLDPTPRRLSQYFDASEWDDLDLEGVEFGESDDEDGENSRPLDKKEIDPDDQPPPEPWLERDATGRRVRPLPDLHKLLGDTPPPPPPPAAQG